MSSSLSSRAEPSSRGWWSLKQTSNKDLRQSFSEKPSSRDHRKPSNGLSLNSLASAMGIKSKKHPSLAIQEPPSPMRNPYPSPVPPNPDQYARPKTSPAAHTNRPPSKSISSIRSRVESLEPRTPLDGQRDTASKRQSLLTLSDDDPFASRGISSPYTPLDSNRLSAYSNSSIPDFISKQPESPMFNRGSYASSSSLSHNHASDAPPRSPAIFASGGNVQPQRRLSPQKSTGSLHRKPSLLPSDGSLGSAWETLAISNGTHVAKSFSSTTLIDKNRHSHPDPPAIPRPPMRARGMTDGGTRLQAPFLRDDRESSKLPSPSHTKRFSPTPQPTSPLSPRVIVRQASTSRIGQPMSAPPAHDLPPPPAAVGKPVEDVPDGLFPVISAGSASSSSLSFASTLSSNREISMVNQHYSPRVKTPRQSNQSFFLKLEPDPEPVVSEASWNPLQTPRTLKKALSHQSLSKHRPPPTASTPTSPSSEHPPDKAPRKQRSFHHPRIPLPSLPHRQHSSPGPSHASSSKESKEVTASPDPKKSGSGSRKRLFSGSSMRRPSTSQCVADDDSRSVFSLPDQERTSATITRALSSSQTVSQSSFWDDPADTPSSPQPTLLDYTPQQIMSPAEMLKVEASLHDSVKFTRQRGLSIVSASTIGSDREYESVPGSLSLPFAMYQPEGGRKSGAPLRTSSKSGRGAIVAPRLPRPSTSQATSAGMISLAPPPRARPRTSTASAPQLEEGPAILPLSPPPRTRVRKVSMEKPIVQKASRRRSIMKKPSFLDIDDDLDKDDDTGKPMDSFLDFARESFDTVRSDD